MLVCEQYEVRISALIDDELPAGERLEVLEHLAGCPACKAYWEELLLIRDALREPEQKAPAGFADAVMARVRATAQEPCAAAEKKTLRFPGWKRVAGLAACCAVVLLGVWAMDFAPEMLSGGMNDCTVRNGAAPQMYAEDSNTGSAVWDYGLDTAAGAEEPEEDSGAYNAYNNADCGVPESTGETDDAKDARGESDYGEDIPAATLMTDSEVARKWVQDTLGEDWVSGESYTLSEEQYSVLRKALEDAGEQFNEIMGEKNDGSYRLLAE